jgi:hypothetical protein
MARLLYALIMPSLLTLSVCRTSPRMAKKLSKAEVYSVPYSIETVRAVRPNELINGRDAYHSVITDFNKLQILDSLLEMPKDSVHYNCMDARIVCLLYYQPATVDTLVLNNECMTIDSQCYSLNDSLLDFLYKLLPREHQESIDYYRRRSR